VSVVQGEYKIHSFPQLRYPNSEIFFEENRNGPHGHSTNEGFDGSVEEFGRETVHGTFFLLASANKVNSGRPFPTAPIPPS
jgi:hypothetical protein